MSAGVVDFEHARALRLGEWIRWTERQPPNDLVIRLRGDMTLTGGGAPEDGSKFVRRSQVLGMITPSGSLHLVLPPYAQLEWTSG